MVILASQAPEAGVVAYDKLTGNVEWSTPPLGAVGYVSPELVNVGGEAQVIMITAATRASRRDAGSGGKVVGIDAISGKILWEYNGFQCVVPVPSAVDCGDSRVLITGGYEAGAIMLQIEKKSDESYGITELFKTVEFGSHTISPILYNGHFYAHYSTNERRDGMACMSIDGEIKWKTMRSPSFDKGSMVFADRMLLSTDGGTMLYLIDPDPSAFKAISSVELSALEGERRSSNQNWAPMALADGMLLVRSQSRLVCVKVSE
jgi:hypothetical protein